MSELVDRHVRLDNLIKNAHRIVDEAIHEHVTSGVGRQRREVAAIVLLFSGGNDSTVLAHLFRDRATHAAHANTTIGIEATRQFVRDTCASWGLPLLERFPPPDSTYEAQVIERGFPGPAQHWKMYHRLKLRALEQVQRELVGNPYRRRVVFLAGRRLAESARRTQREIPYYERRKSVVWVSPLRDWRAMDMNTYRTRFPDCPRNQVPDLIHMSGECLCGAFAAPGELDEIGYWFPDVRADIEVLQDKVRAAGHPEERCRWGWGAYRDRSKAKSGPLCSSCEFRAAAIST